MQATPLLEKLDWTFTSPDWTTKFPTHYASPWLGWAQITLPFMYIGTYISKANIFRFEIYWLDLEGFQDTILLTGILLLSNVMLHRG
jgi:hypothetical protein